MLAQKQAIEQFILGAKGRLKVMRTSKYIERKRFLTEEEVSSRLNNAHFTVPSSSALSIALAETKNSIAEVEPLKEEEGTDDDDDDDDDDDEKIIQDANTSVELSDELKFILELKNIWKTRVHYPQLVNGSVAIEKWKLFRGLRFQNHFLHPTKKMKKDPKLLKTIQTKLQKLLTKMMKKKWNYKSKKSVLHVLESKCLEGLPNHDSFPKAAFQCFEELRRLGKLCDVTLLVNGSKFHAHRIVLAATIPYFKAMFTHDMAEKSLTQITVQGVNEDVLESLINYCYTGRLTISSESVQALLIGASYLQMDLIVEACCKLMMQSLSATNAVAMLRFSRDFACEMLHLEAIRYVLANFVPVSKTDEFLNLTFEEIFPLLSNDELLLSGEEDVFQAATRWVKHDAKEREVHLPTLLACVRFPLLDLHYLTNWIENEPLVAGNEHCMKLINEAEEYFVRPELRPLLKTFKNYPRFCSASTKMLFAVGGLDYVGYPSCQVHRLQEFCFADIFFILLFRLLSCGNTWVSVEPMNLFRARAGVAVTLNKLFVIGGNFMFKPLRQVEVYDLCISKWKSVASLMAKRSALGAVAYGDHIYACGGHNGFSSLSSVEKYSIKDDKWTSSPSMKKCRSAPAVVLLDGRIFVIGGHDGIEIFNSVECFDPNTGLWTFVRPMLTRRCRLGAAVLNGKIYVAGGCNGTHFLRSVECYDPVKDEWSFVCNMNVARSRISVAEYQGKIYVAGGYDGINNLCTVEVFTPETNSFQFGPCLHGHEGSLAIAAVPVNI
ncbi:Kelch-like protein 18 [Trichinella pseudospiralis]|uniref:Kelch-like protein 18 n=1 Tax=Trichinella pseudospiralis TaxID=6337 RepID=A0A0V0XSS7_TRIPS|nr:Kelch-like protein 18 [Trichinella pseudospiralis]